MNCSRIQPLGALSIVTLVVLCATDTSAHESRATKLICTASVTTNSFYERADSEEDVRNYHECQTKLIPVKKTLAGLELDLYVAYKATCKGYPAGIVQVGATHGNEDYSTTSLYDQNPSGLSVTSPIVHNNQKFRFEHACRISREE